MSCVLGSVFLTTTPCSRDFQLAELPCCLSMQRYISTSNKQWGH
jgi:hypothetical protein